MPWGSLLVPSNGSHASGRTSPHSTVESSPDYRSEEEEADVTIEPMVRSDETKSVHGTRATPVHQAMKVPALRTQPKALAANVRFEGSSQARYTDVRQESSSKELPLQTRTLDMWPLQT